MTAVNPAGPTGFGPTPGPSNPDFVPFFDSVDFTDVFYPQQTPSGGLAPVVLDPKTVTDVQGMPGGMALLIEMRIANYLAALAMGSAAPDLDQLRASEFFRISIATGTLGGDGN